MPVSISSSRAVYEALKAGGIRLLSALPETWLVHLIRMAVIGLRPRISPPADHQEIEPVTTLYRMVARRPG